MEEVKVIGSTTSLFCTRIEWALKLKGVEYEYIQEDLTNKSAMLLEYNPVHKKVPILVHNGKPICESLVILEYIEDTWKDAYPLLPQDSYEHAMIRFWAKYVDDKCIIGGFWRACTTQGEEKKEAIETLVQALTYLEKQIEGKMYFGGDQIGYLDLAVGWIPLYFSVLEEVGNVKLTIEQEKFPFLHEWSQNFSLNPLIQSCLPHRQHLADYLTASVYYVRSLAAKSS